MCLCNGLAATVGLPQSRAGGLEPPLVTAGNDVSEVARMVRNGAERYSAADVVRYLRGAEPEPVG